MIEVFCRCKGKTVCCKISQAVYDDLFTASLLSGKPKLNIASAAFKKYGVSEESLAKYLREDMKLT